LVGFSKKEHSRAPAAVVQYSSVIDPLPSTYWGKMAINDERL